MSGEKVEILDVPFNNLTRKEFLKEIFLRVKLKRKTFIVTANPEIVMYARRNEAYQRLLQDADLVAADGIGIVRAAKKLGRPVKERVPGFELMIGLLELADRHQKSVYFIGAKEETLQKTIKNVQGLWPQLKIAGYHHGYFDHSDPVKIEMVKDSEPDIILVALGFPRQEKWIKRYLNKADHGVAIGVGGSFDVLSGNTKRAPKIIQKYHLEWFYRLVKQPSRYKRMLVLPEFIREVSKQNKKERVKK